MGPERDRKCCGAQEALSKSVLLEENTGHEGANPTTSIQRVFHAAEEQSQTI